MFPFKHGDELSFQAAGNNPEDHKEDELEGGEHPQPQDPVLNNELLAAVNLYTTTPTTTPRRGRGRRAEDGEDDWRKMVHRDIERQRRQEMSSLFSNLRSLLPLNYIKGKRSMSDHIAESVNYIKQLEVRIKDLGDRRDHLSNLSHGEGSHSRIQNCNVEIFMTNNSDTLQVQITSGQQGLSRVLKVLLEARLDVVSCVTNKVDDTLLHNIHCQVTDVGWGDTDVQQLQQRLYEALIGS